MNNDNDNVKLLSSSSSSSSSSFYTRKDKSIRDRLGFGSTTNRQLFIILLKGF